MAGDCDFTLGEHLTFFSVPVWSLGMRTRRTAQREAAHAKAAQTAGVRGAETAVGACCFMLLLQKLARAVSIRILRWTAFGSFDGISLDEISFDGISFMNVCFMNVRFMNVRFTNLTNILR